jgi:thiol-disulfide isomerase/thioredoxin
MGKKKSSVLKVDMESKIPELEKILKNGKVTIVLVFADWCGHCHKFQKDIWNPMCNKEATHNRVSVRDDMMSKTSLNSAKFDYLPSVMVVNEKGELENFPTPEGNSTNVIPTPKSLEDMNRIVNVPLKQASATGIMSQNQNNSLNSNFENNENKMRGGALLQTLQDVGQGIIPVGVLGSLSLMLKGGRRSVRSGRKTRKHKRSKKHTRKHK